MCVIILIFALVLVCALGSIFWMAFIHIFLPFVGIGLVIMLLLALLGVDVRVIK